MTTDTKVELPVIDMNDVVKDRATAAKKVVSILANVGVAFIDNVEGMMVCGTLANGSSANR